MRCALILGLVGVLATQLAGCPQILTETTIPTVQFETSQGNFVVELDPVNAPITVENFLGYVNDGFYDGTIFQRVIPGFVIQGGGLTPDLVEKEVGPPIVNESDNGLLNTRGTIAMARMDDPDSAAAQFFINLADNTELDPSGQNAGYAVFGHVTEGMDVIDQIAQIPTEQRGDLSDVPTEDVIIEHAEEIDLPGTIEVTPEGEAYLQDQGYRTLLLVRELLVDLVHFTIVRPFY